MGISCAVSFTAHKCYSGRCSRKEGDKWATAHAGASAARESMLEVRPARNSSEVITKRDSVVNTGIRIFLTQPLYLLMDHTFKWTVQKIDSRSIEKKNFIGSRTRSLPVSWCYWHKLDFHFLVQFRCPPLYL